MATPNYDINFNDKRLTDVKKAETSEIKSIDKQYGEMIGDTDEYYQKLVDDNKAWADKQQQLQQDKTDFAIEKIEQQKEQAHKDYIKEQSGAYVDWQKQSNPYGANAEQLAAAGLAGSGYHESSQVAMYNTYQNRVAAAHESYNQLVLNYDNAIKDAQLQNSSILAEIAYEASKQQAEWLLQAFQYKNALLVEQANNKREAKQMYHTFYQDVLDQMNKENALKEEARQADMDNERYLKQIKLAKAELKLAQDKFDYEKKQNSAAIPKSNASSGETKRKTTKKSGKKSTTNSTNRSWVQSNKPTGGSSTANSASTKPPVDMKSLVDCGYAGISAKRAYELVKQGILQTYVSGGKTKFKRSATYIGNSLLTGKTKSKSNADWIVGESKFKRKSF